VLVVEEWETVRRRILEQAGWVEDEGRGQGTPDQEFPGQDAPAVRRIEVTTHDSEGPEFIEIPAKAPASKRKRGA
jgi:hypothetical protein